jgi:hypothetical protein
VIAPSEWHDEVQQRIFQWATNTAPPQEYLKEPTWLPEVLKPSPLHPLRVSGWLELDNGFMFFTNEEMWQRTCALFSVDVPDQEPVKR